MKVPVDAPAVMVTVAGTEAYALLEPRLTTTPPGPALPFKATVPVELAPPITEAGEIVRLWRLAGVTVRVADWVIVPCDAVIETETVLATEDELIENEAEDAPANTVTLA